MLPLPLPTLDGVERVRESLRERRSLVRLDRNERLAPLPASFLEPIRAALDSDVLSTYPVPDGVVEQLAASLGLSTAEVLLTPGSDAAFRSLFQAYVRPGDSVVLLEPSYAMYSIYAQIAQATVRAIPFDRRLTVDVAELLDAVRPGVRLVVIANPNQPTGTSLDEPTMEQLLERAAAANALLVVDEAYYPFSRLTMLPRLRCRPCLMVTRTCSKAAGLAGVRIGFVAAHPNVVRNLIKVRSAHDVNSVALRCLQQLLAQPEVMEDYVEEVNAGRRVLMERATALGLEPITSPTNFLVIRVAHRCPPAALVEVLRRRGYLVKGPFSAPCLAPCIRVTLGPPALMASFADTLQGALEDVGGLVPQDGRH